MKKFRVDNKQIFLSTESQQILPAILLQSEADTVNKLKFGIDFQYDILDFILSQFFRAAFQ